MTASHRLETRHGVGVLTWPIFDDCAADIVVTSTTGGVSVGPYTSLNLGLHVGDDPASVIQNRERAARTVGLTLDDLVFCRQSHDRNVARVGPGDRGRGARVEQEAIEATDAMVTCDPDVGLVVMVADCVPIVLLDPDAGVLSTVHAGWRGTTKRVVAAAVEEMVAMGASAAQIRAGVGPAIPADRYQVGEDVLAAAEDAFGNRAGALLKPDGTGRWLFDLWAANRLTLQGAGVDGGRVQVAEVATGDDFFSDRTARPCGRFAAIARLRP